MLIRNNKLTPAQKQDLELLMSCCHAAGGGLPKIYPDLLDQARDTDSNFLYYQNDVLAGFASVYFFYEDACEVSLLVDPALRQQGIARKLLKTMVPLIHGKGMQSVIFSFSDMSDNSWLHALDFVYHNSEYHMRRNAQGLPELINPVLQMRKASMEDIPDMIVLDNACFPGNQADMNERFTRLLQNSEYEILVAEIDGHVIGKAHLHWHPDSVWFSDIAILPAWQGKGLGSELLTHSIREVLLCGEGIINLDVEVDRSTALNLYLKQGFDVITRFEYWQIDMDKVLRIFPLP